MATSNKSNGDLVPGRSQIQLGLDAVSSLLVELGNPHHQIRCVHVAGTNGKGSTSAYLAALLRCSFRKVGLYSSPHLLHPRDAVQINGLFAAEQVFAAILIRVQNAANSVQIAPTTFEMLTAACMLYFVHEKVDIAVVEVGVGGRLDATNIWSNSAAASCVLATVMTRIGVDHVNLLGNTVAEIAAHKAGIMCSNVDCFVAMQSSQSSIKSEVLGALRQEARKASTRLVHVVYDLDRSLGTYRVFSRSSIDDNSDHQMNTLICTINMSSFVDSSICGYQYENLSTALAVYHALQPSAFNTSESILGLTSNLVKAIVSVHWRGRLDWVELPVSFNYSTPTIRALLDGAHNLDGAKALRSYLDSPGNNLNPDTSITWIVAFTQGRDIQEFLTTITQPGDVLYAVPFSQPEGMQWIQCYDPQEIATIASTLDLVPIACSTLDEAINKISSSSITNIVITGSLYLAADVYRRIVNVQT